MIRSAIFIIAGSLALSGCAINQQTENRFSGERSVFHNPYVAPELAQGNVGPETGDPLVDARRPYLDGLFYPGRGEYAYDREGNRVRLSRESQRSMRLRTQTQEALAERDRQEAAMRAGEAERRQPPLPSVPPIARSNGSSNPD